MSGGRNPENTTDVDTRIACIPRIECIRPVDPRNETAGTKCSSNDGVRQRGLSSRRTPQNLRDSPVGEVAYDRRNRSWKR